MQLSSRSLWLVLFLGLGCGPTGFAEREADSEPVLASGAQGGNLGNGTNATTGGTGGLGTSSVAGSGGVPSPQATGGVIGTGGAPAGQGGAGGSEPAAPGAGGTGNGGAGRGGTGGVVSGADAGTPASADSGAPAVPVTGAELLARLSTCQELTSGRYAADDGGSASVAVCGLPGAVFWKTDMDINCNGKTSSSCNTNTDPGYKPETAGRDSLGAPLNAATLPFVVIPGPSTRFDYRKHEVALGSVVAVIYKGQVEFGVVGEVGAVDIIGEASYAMAKKLGIDANPATGGVGSGVTYVVFTGLSGQVAKLEDRAETVRIGQARAADLLR